MEKRLFLLFEFSKNYWKIFICLQLLVFVGKVNSGSTKIDKGHIQFHYTESDYAKISYK